MHSDINLLESSKTVKIENVIHSFKPWCESVSKQTHVDKLTNERETCFASCCMKTLYSIGIRIINMHKTQCTSDHFCVGADVACVKDNWHFVLHAHVGKDVKSEQSVASKQGHNQFTVRVNAET